MSTAEALLATADDAAREIDCRIWPEWVGSEVIGFTFSCRPCSYSARSQRREVYDTPTTALQCASDHRREDGRRSA